MTFVDQLGAEVTLNATPKRIVSLVPSQSEFLWDLGLRSELVGVTRFCIHPMELKSKSTMVGGTKKLNVTKILDLRPDVVIGNKEENELSQIDELRKHVPVWMSDIVSLEDAYGMMTVVGRMVGKEREAHRIVSDIRSGLATVQGSAGRKRVAYFIWSRPYMFAGSSTFIDHVLTHAGFVNAVGTLERYPVLEIEDLHNARPDLCFLSSEPYPFNESHRNAIAKLLPESKVLLVDGEMFSWYGSRLKKLPAYLKTVMAQISGSGPIG